MSALTQPLTHRIAEFACLAPSVHNTQPWRWRIRNDHLIELWADRDRQLRVADPDGRNLAISCGAALHHFIVASRALGAISTVDLTPVGGEPDLLATIRLSPGRTASDAAESLEVLTRRRTDRRRFTSWPVPESRLAHLTRRRSGMGRLRHPHPRRRCAFPHRAVAQPCLDHPAVRPAPRRGATDVDRAQLGRRRPVVERLATVPGPHVRSPEPVRRPAPDRHHRCPGGELGRVGRGLHHHGRPTIVAGGRAGAQRPVVAGHGGRVVTRAVEPGDRGGRDQGRLCYHDVFTGLAHPQILLRIGWQEISRASLDPSPRRPVADVLLA